jgi:hypothetical protein
MFGTVPVESAHREIGEDLADQRRKLETVPGAG